MKRITIALATLLFIACSKDGISPKNKRNNCENCVLNYVDPNGNVVYTLKYTDQDSFANINFCDYLIEYKEEYNTNVAPSGIYFAEIKCN